MSLPQSIDGEELDDVVTALAATITAFLGTLAPIDRDRAGAEFLHSIRLGEAPAGAS